MSFPNAQNNPAGAIPVYNGGSGYTNFATDTAGTLRKTGPGVFEGLVVNSHGTASTATVYDGLTSGGTLIATFSTTAQISLPVGAQFSVGLFVVTASSGAANLTVLWR